jgi:hypothetical protein
MENYIGFVYLWKNNINEKMYIGSHIGKVDDGYIGSGVYFKKAVKKYGIENFDKCILYFEHLSKENLYQKEYELINEYNAVYSNDFYNLCNISPNHLKFVNGKCHKIVREETKKKMSCIAKNRIVSEETKKKMSKNNYNKGKKWYNNGIISKTFKEDDVPAGWVLGMLSNKQNNTTQGYKFYTDGVNNIFLSPDKEPPIGWVLGRTLDIKGSKNPFFGKKHSEETKRKIIETKKLRGITNKGANNPAAVKIKVNNKLYLTIKDAMKDTGYSYKKINKIGERIINENNQNKKN